MDNGPWYHGSPLRLEQLQRGSVVTPFKELAKAFSHKPSKVSTSDDCKTVKHNGQLPGFLYIITENVTPDDILEIPGTDGTHWQIQRSMQVELLRELPVSEPPLITEEDIVRLMDDRPGDHISFIGR